MNRHHPYNQSFENSRRGGNSSGVFGPDRSHHRGGHRGGGRNIGRNRGGGSFNNTYDSSPIPYDQGPPPQGDSGPYNNYSNVQDPYYLNGGGYNAGPPDQYGAGAQDGYGQGYTGSFEGALELETERFCVDFQTGIQVARLKTHVNRVGSAWGT